MTGAGVRVLEQVATRSERAQSVIGEGHDTLQAGRQDIGGQPHPERVVRTDPGREVGERGGSHIDAAVGIIDPVDGHLVDS